VDPILIINLSKWFGGAEIRVLELAYALRESGAYGVVTLNNSPLHRKLSKAGLNVLSLPFARGDFRIAISINRIIKRFGFKIIDMHNPQSQLWGILSARLAGLNKTVTTVHNSKDPTVSLVKNLLYEKVLQLNSKLNSQFIAVSDSVKEFLLNLKIEPDRISTIPNAIRFSKNYVKDKNPKLRQAFGFRTSDYIVIVVGRLEPVKGHRYLIQALKKVVKMRSNLKCLFVGDGRDRAALESKIIELQLDNFVKIAGFREDVSSLLAMSDAFCLPSISEGLPYALLEACSYRLPLLLTKVGGMNENLKNGESAIMVPPKDAAALSNGLLKLIDNPQISRAWGDRAYEVIKKKFSTKKMISSTFSIYKNLDN